MIQKHFVVWALSLLLSATIVAQTVQDDFNGGFDPSLPWSWKVIVPDSTDAPCYWDSANPDWGFDQYIEFTTNALQVAMHPWGSVFAQFNYPVGYANLPVCAAQAGWVIEAEITLDLQGNTPSAYTQTGLMAFQDLDNFYQYMILVDPNQSPVPFWVSTAQEVAQSNAYGGASAGFWNAGENSVTYKLRIEDAGDGNATFLVDLNDGNGWLTVATIPTPAMLNTVLTDGGYIGFFNVAGFTGATQPMASYNYLRLENIRLRQQGDINCDGCVDNADLLAVLFAFGSEGRLAEDVNQDCIVDDADLLAVLFAFGSGC